MVPPSYTHTPLYMHTVHSCTAPSTPLTHVKTLIFLYIFVPFAGLFFSVWAETGDFRDSHSSMTAVANSLDSTHLNNFQTSSSSTLTNRSRDRKDGEYRKKTNIK